MLPPLCRNGKLLLLLLWRWRQARLRFPPPSHPLVPWEQRQSTPYSPHLAPLERRPECKQRRLPWTRTPKDPALLSRPVPPTVGRIAPWAGC